MKLIRWKALIPLVLLKVALVIGWMLFGNAIVRRGVEKIGTVIVGAKVDVAGARVQLARGSVTLRGLQVTDPANPMQNLMEAGELVAAIAARPLLEKKIVIDSLAVRGVRFGTPRQTSGAVPTEKGMLGPVLQRVDDWAKQIRIPSFSLEGLGSVVNISSLSVDSLRTIAAARAIVSGADSARDAWESEIRGFNPRPQIDSAQALLERLKALNLRTLGLQGARDQITTTRATVDNLNRTITQAKALENKVKAGVSSYEDRVTGLAEARLQDYAYARGLVDLPSLEGPDISPALFGQMGLDRIKGLLYWVSVAEQYLPPGLDPRRQAGPKRARASGMTVEFPRARAYPQFLLRYADADFSLSGENLAAGEYQAQIAGVTTQPALYGRPAQFVAQRKGGRVGPSAVRAAAVLDHTRLPLKDSIGAFLSGVGLPTVALPPLSAKVNLGKGVTSLSMLRVGNVLEARFYVRSTQPAWEKVGSASKGFAQDLIWRTVSGIKDVEVETLVRGTLTRPSFSVKSNVGTEIARSLRREVGAQVAKAEAQVRAKVDSAVAGQVAAAREKVDGIKAQALAKVEAQRGELEKVKGELEQKIRDLTPRLPGGIRLPGGGADGRIDG